MNTILDKRSLLDVATRVLGLWQLTVALGDLTQYVNMIQKLYEPLHESPDAVLALAVARGIAGLFLLFSAPRIVNLVYGESQQAVPGPMEPGEAPADKKASP